MLGLWTYGRIMEYIAHFGFHGIFQVLPKHEYDDSYPHVAMVTTPDGVLRPGQKSFLTSGPKEVASLVGVRRYDSQTHLLFYVSTLPGEGGARQRHLYVVDSTLAVGEKCLSCEQSIGRRCSYFNAGMFEDSQAQTEDDAYFVLSCVSDSILYFPDDDAATPFTATYRYKHSTRQVKLVRMLEENAGLKEKLAAYDWPTKEFFHAPIRTADQDDGLIIRGQVFLPPKFRQENSTLKHPVLFNIYSGPSTTKVNDRYTVDFHSYMATTHG